MVILENELRELWSYAGAYPVMRKLASDLIEERHERERIDMKFYDVIGCFYLYERGCMDARATLEAIAHALEYQFEHPDAATSGTSSPK